MIAPSIAILTGAGISAESGLLTFRDNGGLWCGHRVEDVATPEAFARNPALVHEFYNLRRRQLAEVAPNAAHLALAKLSEKWPGEVTIITQNVDDLHERARSNTRPYRLLSMHGKLKQARCNACETITTWQEDLDETSACRACGEVGYMRPHIVWFGELPLHMDEIATILRSCGLFISIGTSGNVYPAAGFVQEVRAIGKAHTVEINLEPSLGRSLFHEHIYGKASETVPEFVGKLLASHRQIAN